MIKKFTFFHFWITLILFANSAWCADKITGNACYTYGDNESLVQAEQMTKTLAIRNAIESYSTFIESTTQIKDFQLSNDLINTVSARQVKRVKVLKRLESGRKLCYTVEGFVEPAEMQNAIKNYLSGQKKGDDARVQENGWIKIVNHFINEESWEAFHKRLSLPMSTSTPKSLKEHISKTLYVKIQFLKPCKARTLSELVNESKTKEATDKYTGITFYILGYGATSDEKERENYRNKVLKLYPDLDEIIEKYYLSPEYACDYRNNIFVSYYNSLGIEIKTEKRLPIAREWGYEKMRKLEMLPGEETFVAFAVPDDAASWKVWVPK